MTKFELREGYHKDGKWHSLNYVANVTYSDGYDLSRIDHITQDNALFIEGIICDYDPDLHAIEYHTAGRGCKCDGCLQDDCDEEIPCTFCNSSSEGQTEYFHLPQGATVELFSRDDDDLDILPWEKLDIEPVISYASDDLIDEVKADIDEFGADEEVCAVVKYFPEYDKFFYTDYDFENIPDEELANEEDTVFMTLGELLAKLEKQNKSMRDEGDEEE